MNSPTGNPLIPVKFVPYLTLLSMLCGAVALMAPQESIVFKVAVGLSTVLGSLGIASPGWRKPLPSDAPIETKGIASVVPLSDPSTFGKMTPEALAAFESRMAEQGYVKQSDGSWRKQ